MCAILWFPGLGYTWVKCGPSNNTKTREVAGEWESCFESNGGATCGEGFWVFAAKDSVIEERRVAKVKIL